MTIFIMKDGSGMPDWSDPGFNGGLEAKDTFENRSSIPGMEYRYYLHGS